MSSLCALASGSAAVAAAPSPAPKYDVVSSVTSTLQGKPGSSVTAVVGWRNAGPAPAPTITITYTPPLGTDIPAASLPAGWSKSGRSAVRVTAAALAPGVARSAGIVVRIPATAVPGTLLVGGQVTARGTTGQDRNPANNTAYNRVQVLAATPTPTPTPKRTPTPTPKPTTPKPTPTVARPTPTVAKPAPTTGAPTTQTTVTRKAAAEPSLTASTFVVAPPRPSAVQPSVTPDVITVTDGQDDSGVHLVPLVGALTCFTAAAVGGVAFKRRREAEQAHVAEVRSLHEIF